MNTDIWKVCELFIRILENFHAGDFKYIATYC